MKLKRSVVIDSISILLGSMITALSLNMFLVPNQVAAGGVSGIATILYYTAGLPVGWTMLALNIPLFIASIKFLGGRFGIRTIVGTFALSVFTEATTKMPVMTKDPLLASVYGGIILGTGLGIVLRHRGTTGGSDLGARLINHFWSGITIGTAIMVIDFFIIAAAGFVFDMEKAMYALFALFISSRVIDFIQEGFNYAKAAFIISDRSGEIAKSIMDEMHRGVTVLGGKGGYTGEHREMLLCVISRMEVAQMKSIVHAIDTSAFVIIYDVHEVLGEGFRYRSAPFK
jgi:uncharacterized membrane-anchored protein YitT (DUF2179 family)